ncbi:MAG: phage terminase small subunit P27 family [Verrucomicrobiota bacterium]
MPAKTHDSKGRVRRVTQGGAGPKKLPSKDAPKAGTFIADAPETLGEHGRAFWKEAVSHLLAMGFIDAADRIFLIHTAEAFELYKSCQAQIQLDGKVMMDFHGNSKAHPLMTTMIKAGKDCFSYLSSLGLTPSARAKFGSTEKEDDPFQDLVNDSKRN